MELDVNLRLYAAPTAAPALRARVMAWPAVSAAAPRPMDARDARAAARGGRRAAACGIEELLSNLLAWIFPAASSSILRASASACRRASRLAHRAHSSDAARPPGDRLRRRAPASARCASRGVRLRAAVRVIEDALSNILLGYPSLPCLSIYAACLSMLPACAAMERTR